MNLFVPGSQISKPVDGTPKKHHRPGSITKVLNTNAGVIGSDSLQGIQTYSSYTPLQAAVANQTAAVSRMMQANTQEASTVLDKTARILHEPTSARHLGSLINTPSYYSNNDQYQHTGSSMYDAPGMVYPTSSFSQYPNPMAPAIPAMSINHVDPYGAMQYNGGHMGGIHLGGAGMPYPTMGYPSMAAIAAMGMGMGGSTHLPYIMPSAMPAVMFPQLLGAATAAEGDGTKAKKSSPQKQKTKPILEEKQDAEDEAEEEGKHIENQESDVEEDIFNASIDSDSEDKKRKVAKAKSSSFSKGKEPVAEEDSGALSSKEVAAALALTAEMQARKEREWDVEKEKRELAFSDIQKELRQELRVMRDKYEHIVKFDAAIHITLAEHRERLKLKQDECDHYVDSKLYEKQKAFDREFAELKIDAKRTEDNYVATMDTYKEVVQKLDTECHRLEAGWTETRDKFEAHKVENEETLAKMSSEHASAVALLKSEYATLKEEFANKEAELRRIKAMNVEKIKMNEELTAELATTTESLTQAKEKVLAAEFNAKQALADKDLAEGQVQRIKAAATILDENLKQSQKKYSDIVAWARNAEQTQKQHDEVMKKNMTQQHEKFNVEYDFMTKQNSTLREEIRVTKIELEDNKALLTKSLEQLKNLFRDNDDRARSFSMVKERAEKAEAKVDEFDRKLAETQRQADLVRERDLRLQESDLQNRIVDLNRKVELKDKVIEEMEHKTTYLRNKVKNLDDILATKDKKIAVLEEQLMFEGRMRELNMQKRAEHENGGVEAIIQLLKMHENNAANLERIQQSNAINLDTVRKDVAALVTQVNNEIKKNAEVGTTQLQAATVSLIEQLQQQQSLLESKVHAEEPSPIKVSEDKSEEENMNKDSSNDIPQNVNETISNAEVQVTSTLQQLPLSGQVTSKPVQIFKDGFGNVINDPFDASRGFTPDSMSSPRAAVSPIEPSGIQQPKNIKISIPAGVVARAEAEIEKQIHLANKPSVSNINRIESITTSNANVSIPSTKTSIESKTSGPAQLTTTLSNAGNANAKPPIASDTQTQIDTLNKTEKGIDILPINASSATPASEIAPKDKEQSLPVQPGEVVTNFSRKKRTK